MTQQDTMRNGFIFGLSARCFLAWLCAVLLGVSSACGSRQEPPTRLPALEESTVLPNNADALRAWMEEVPTTAETAFLQAHVHMLDVDVKAMHQTLLSPIFDDAAPMLRVGRMALLLANSDTLIDKAPLHEWVATRDVTTMAPQERVLFTELQQTLRMKELEREDAEKVPSALALGGATDWNVVGPMSLVWSEEILERGDAASVQSLDDLALQGPQRKQTYPTVMGRFAHNPQPDGVGYYESFLRVDVPTRVAVTRFGARDFFSVWIDDAPVMQRGVEEANTARYQMPVYDLSPGVYRVLMTLRSNAQSIQPPHIIALDGAIAEFSADAGPAHNGRVTRVSNVAADLTEALARGEEDDVSTWLVHAAVAMLGDDELAYRLVHMDVGEKHPAIELVRARLLDFVRDMPIADSLALQILRGVPDSWGEVLGVSLKESQIVFRTSEDLDAARSLATMAQRPNAPPHLRSAFAHTMRQLKFDALAFTTLKQLTEEYPDWCSAWDSYLHLALSYRGVLEAEDFSNAPTDCQEVRWLKTVVTEQWQGDNVEYIEAQRRMMMRSAHAPDSATDFFWHLLQADGPDAAEAHLGTLKNHGLKPEDLIAEYAAIALLRNGAVGLEELLQRFVKEHPDRDDTQMVLARLTGAPVIEDMRVDGKKALETYQQSQYFTQSKPDSVYVLDYAAWHLFENGGALNVTHQMVELNSNDAIREMGELGLPKDVEVLELRAIKPDGSVRTPERTSGKSALSMPNMEVGDVLEMETLQFIPEPADGRAHIASGAFYFQSSSTPMFRSQMRVDYPQRWAENVIVETFNFEGEHEKSVQNGRVQELLTVDNSPSIRAERWTPDFLEYGPWAQFQAYENFEIELQRYNDHVLQQVAPSPDIDALTAKVIEKSKGDEEKIRALFRYVVDEMEQTSGFFGVNARQSARMKQGARLPLLYAMLESAGFSPHLSFIESYDMPKYPSDILSVDHFDAIALYVETKKSSYWLDVSREFAPFDRLAAHTQGQPALLVTGARRGETLQTPKRGWEDAVDKESVEIWLDKKGNARLETVLTFGGDESANWRDALEYMPNNDERHRAMESYLSNIYGQVTLTDVVFEGEKAPDDPLVIRMKATVEELADVNDDALVIDRMFDDVALLSSYTASSTRRLPLLVDVPMFDVLEVAIHPPENYEIVRGLSAEKIEHGEDSYLRNVERTADHGIHWTRSVKVQRKRIEPTEYQLFANFGQKVRNAERVRMTWQRK